MPRISAAARAAAQWRAEGAPPAKPKLPAAAGKLWDEIIADRPADHFRPGSLHLLATYCLLSAEMHDLLQQPRATLREAADAMAALLKLGQMAEKLALSPNSALARDAGAATERGARNPLLGGHAAAKRPAAKK